MPSLIVPIALINCTQTLDCIMSVLGVDIYMFGYNGQSAIFDSYVKNLSREDREKLKVVLIDNSVNNETYVYNILDEYGDAIEGKPCVIVGDAGYDNIAQAHGFRHKVLTQQYLTENELLAAFALANTYDWQQAEPLYEYGSKLKGGYYIKCTISDKNKENAELVLAQMLSFLKGKTADELQSYFESQSNISFHLRSALSKALGDTKPQDLFSKVRSFAQGINSDSCPNKFTLIEYTGQNRLQTYHGQTYSAQHASVTISKNGVNIASLGFMPENLAPLADSKNNKTDSNSIRNETDPFKVHQGTRDLLTRAQTFNLQPDLPDGIDSLGELQKFLKNSSESYLEEFNTGLGHSAMFDAAATFKSKVKDSDPNARISPLLITPLMVVVMRYCAVGFGREFYFYPDKVKAEAILKLQILKEAGADFNAVDIFGRNALFWVAAGAVIGLDTSPGRTEMVRLLIEYGTDPLHVDRDGRPASYWLKLDGCSSTKAIPLLEAEFAKLAPVESAKPPVLLSGGPGANPRPKKNNLEEEADRVKPDVRVRPGTACGPSCVIS